MPCFSMLNMLGYPHIQISIMDMTAEEWEELCALKNAINDYPASVHYEKMELFTKLMVKSLDGKADPINGVPVRQVVYPSCPLPQDALY